MKKKEKKKKEKEKENYIAKCLKHVFENFKLEGGDTQLVHKHVSN